MLEMDLEKWRTLCGATTRKLKQLEPVVRLS